MKVAVIGSRGIKRVNLEKFLPKEVTEIVSGGAVGVDTCAAEYARRKNLKLTVFKPEYDLYGRVAPLKRNDEIIDYADMVLAFWDGTSHGTLYVMNRCRTLCKNCRFFILKEVADKNPDMRLENGSIIYTPRNEKNKTDKKD